MPNRTLIPTDSFRYQSQPGTSRQHRPSVHESHDLSHDLSEASHDPLEGSEAQSIASTIHSTTTHTRYACNTRLVLKWYSYIQLSLYMLLCLSYRPSLDQVLVLENSHLDEPRRSRGGGEDSNRQPVTLTHLAHSLSKYA